jgi:hypothetical protein
MKVFITYNFKPNLLEVYAETDTTALPTFNGPRSDPRLTAKIYRHYPLSELEARALHFKGSSPIDWIEKHMVQLVRLEAFDRGYDARYAERDEIELVYAPCLTQIESGETHVYQWTHDRAHSLLTLTDNGIQIVHQPVRGPQEYQSLGVHMEEIRAVADKPVSIAPTVEVATPQ